MAVRGCLQDRCLHACCDSWSFWSFHFWILIDFLVELSDLIIIAFGVFDLQFSAAGVASCWGVCFAVVSPRPLNISG